MSRRSAPEEKPRPAPVTHTARTASSAATSSIAASRSSPNCLFQAFMVCGRFSSMVAAAPRRWMVTVSSSVMARHPMCCWLSGQPTSCEDRPAGAGSVEGMANRPVIGLCAALERASWGVWSTEAHLLPREYADAVQRAGGIALILPPDPRALEQPEELLDLLDGLILAGGTDVDPDAYGAERHPATINTNPERDAFEIALAQAAIAR